MIWNFRYRKTYGATDGRVEAADPVEAAAVAEAYCAQHPGYRYIPGSVEPFILADASILATVAAATPKTQPNGEPLESSAGLAGAGVAMKATKAGRVGA